MIHPIFWLVVYKISLAFHKIRHKNRKPLKKQQEHCTGEIIEVIIEETNEINVKWNYLQPLLRDMVKHNENAANEQKYIDHLGKFFFYQKFF